MTSVYDLSVDEIVNKIETSGAKRVLIQLPDGLKPEAAMIQKQVCAKLPDIELFFWGGSAFGACDLPLSVEKIGFDLLLHLGHASWR